MKTKSAFLLTSVSLLLLGAGPVALPARADLLVLAQTQPLLFRYDETTRALLSAAPPPEATESLVGLAVGPDGNIYVGEDTLGRGGVVRFNGRTSAAMDVFIAFEDSGGLMGPFALSFGPDGQLYVAGALTNNPQAQVLRYDGTTGAFLGPLVTPGSGGLTGIRDMSFGPDGNLYLLDPQQGVLRYSGADGHFLSVFVSGASLSFPQNLAFGPTGDLFVSFSTNGVLRFNGTNGSLLGTFIDSAGRGSLENLSFGPDTNLYVSSIVSNSVLRYSGNTGAFMDAFPLPTNGPPFAAGPSFTAIIRPLTNHWTSLVSGRWEDLSWSLGVPPSSNQAVLLDNAGFKAVGILPATARDFPATLTVDTLAISAPPGSLNTLLLNFAGTAPPLRVLDGLSVSTNGRLVSLFSGLLVERGGLRVTGGEISQDGGFTALTNGSMLLDGTFSLTNGTLLASNLAVGVNSTGGFNQYGGTASAGSLLLGQGFSGTGNYNLNGGNVLASSIVLGGSRDCAFTQNGGTNAVGNLVVQVQLSGGASDYFLNGGFLAAGNETILSGDFNLGTFHQTGGTHVITNGLSLQGEVFPTGAVFPARYVQTGGDTTAAALDLGSYAAFALSNGTMRVAGAVRFTLLNSLARLTSFLAGGTLACSDFSSLADGANLTQSGGALVVSNLLSFGGFEDSPPLGSAVYNFSGGTLSASNIELTAALNLGSSGQTGRITNPGFFRLAGALTTGAIHEQLGSFMLAGDSTLDLNQAAATLAFADSSKQPWLPGAALFILGWNGSTNGDGAARLSFGTNALGLRASQLGQMLFVNPAGFANTTNFAKLLPTGEVVPTAQPALLITLSGQTLVLSWPGTFSLQAATNVFGPYLDVAGASSPFLASSSSAPTRFFRLRQ